MEDKKKFWNRIPYWLLGIYMAAIVVFSILLFIQLWPYDEKAPKTIKFLGLFMPQERDAQILIIVFLSGIIGSSIHSMTSFATYLGNRSEKISWVWWYYLRPFIGACLALLFYALIRGGFLAAGSQPSDINLFGVVSVAGLVGMFSKQAIDKLRELFDNFFRIQAGKGDDIRTDKLMDKKLVNDVMLPVEKIVFFTLPKEFDESEIKLSVLYEKFNGMVTRLPIVTQELVVKYLIHESILNKFIAKHSIKNDTQKDPKSLTLKDMTSDEYFRKFIEESLVFVSPDTPLSEAKKRMEEIKHCQDVIITEKGHPGDKMLGWLPNIDISKNIEKKSD